MLKNEVFMMALKEIPRINKALNAGESNAKNDMKLIISTLDSQRIPGGQAMALASTDSLIKATEGRTLSSEMAQLIKASSLRDLSCSFNCEADFKDENKIKLLKGLL